MSILLADMMARRCTSVRQHSCEPTPGSVSLASEWCRFTNICIGFTHAVVNSSASEAVSHVEMFQGACLCRVHYYKAGETDVCVTSTNRFHVTGKSHSHNGANHAIHELHPECNQTKFK